MTREMEVPSSTAKKITDTFLKRFRRCVENPRMNLDEYRILLWIQALGEDFEDLAEDIYPRWRKLRYRNLAVPESTLNMLKLLHKQYQLALVTNGPSRSQWEKIHELKLEQHFDSIIVSGDLKWEKPQPEIFHRACTCLGVEPFECLMVGDKIETDIYGGFQAQLGITVWVPNGEPGESTPSPPPDFVISDISNLMQVLQGGKDKAKTTKNVRPKKASTSSSAATASCSTSASPVASTSSSSGVTKTPAAQTEEN